MKLRKPLSTRELHLLAELKQALEEHRWADMLDHAREGLGVAKRSNLSTVPHWQGAWDMCADLMGAGVGYAERRTKAGIVVTYIGAVRTFDGCSNRDRE